MNIFSDKFFTCIICLLLDALLIFTSGCFLHSLEKHTGSVHKLGFCQQFTESNYAPNYGLEDLPNTSFFRCLHTRNFTPILQLLKTPGPVQLPKMEQWEPTLMLWQTEEDHQHRNLTYTTAFPTSQHGFFLFLCGSCISKAHLTLKIPYIPKVNMSDT